MSRAPTYRATVFVLLTGFALGVFMGAGLQQWLYGRLLHARAAPAEQVAAPVAPPQATFNPLATTPTVALEKVIPVTGATSTAPTPMSPAPTRIGAPGLDAPDLWGVTGSKDHLALLILGVDSLESPSPALKSIWISHVSGQSPQAFLLGLPPATLVRQPTYAERRLSEYYALDRQIDARGALFLEALSSVNAAPIQGTVTLDSRVLAQMVNQLGGVNLGSDLLDGLGALQYLLNAGPDDPVGQLHVQTALLEAGLNAAEAKGDGLDLSAYLDLIYTYGQVNISRPRLEALLRPLFPLSRARVAIAPASDSAMQQVMAADGRPAIRLVQSLAAIP